MLNENRMRLLIFLTVALIHVVLIFFLTFNLKIEYQAPGENARMMKLTDFSEIEPEPPPPPPPQEIQIPIVESIAETMIETETVPEQIIAAPGTITTPVITAPSWDEYLPAHKVTTQPDIDALYKAIQSDIVYPPIAQRSGIEGRVILELFIDRYGQIQRIEILQERPEGRGFGEAAVKASIGKRTAPAKANGENVSARVRLPVVFKLK